MVDTQAAGKLMEHVRLVFDLVHVLGAPHASLARFRGIQVMTMVSLLYTILA